MASLRVSSKLSVWIKLDGCVSSSLCVNGSVRQGDVLFPMFFNVYVNKFLITICKDDTGCHLVAIALNVSFYAL